MCVQTLPSAIRVILALRYPPPGVANLTEANDNDPIKFNLVLFPTAMQIHSDTS